MSPKKQKEQDATEDIGKALTTETRKKKRDPRKGLNESSDAKSLTTGAFIVLVILVGVSILSLGLTTKSSKKHRGSWAARHHD